MSPAPQVTVLIPVYNREKYVAEAIDSILAQSFTDFELLLIDDGSTDRSLEIMQSYRDPRIRLVCHAHNLGIPRTRNTGIGLARGEYIAMLDSDDYAYPKRLAKQVAFLKRHHDYALVGSWTAAMNAGSRLVWTVKILPVTSDDIRARLLFRCPILQYAIMARTAILRAYEYRNQYVVCEDFDLFVRLAQEYKLGNLPEFLVRRRNHTERITRDRVQLVKTMNLEILTAQLYDLGVEWNATDLERHFFLLRLPTSPFRPDHAYLTWANAWLLRLQEANRQTLYAPERSFARVIGEIWFLVCWYASASLGWSVWKDFWQSPLSTYSWSSLRQYFCARQYL